MIVRAHCMESGTFKHVEMFAVQVTRHPTFRAVLTAAGVTAGKGSNQSSASTGIIDARMRERLLLFQILDNKVCYENLTLSQDHECEGSKIGQRVGVGRRASKFILPALSKSYT